MNSTIRCEELGSSKMIFRIFFLFINKLFLSLCHRCPGTTERQPFYILHLKSLVDPILEKLELKFTHVEMKFNAMIEQQFLKAKNVMCHQKRKVWCQGWMITQLIFFLIFTGWCENSSVLFVSYKKCRKQILLFFSSFFNLFQRTVIHPSNCHFSDGVPNHPCHICCQHFNFNGDKKRVEITLDQSDLCVLNEKNKTQFILQSYPNSYNL